MSETEVQELRDMFTNNVETEEIVLTEYLDRTLTLKEVTEIIGKLKVESFLNGLSAYNKKYGVYPMKVPVYRLAQQFDNNDQTASNLSEEPFSF